MQYQIRSTLRDHPSADPVHGAKLIRLNPEDAAYAFLNTALGVVEAEAARDTRAGERFYHTARAVARDVAAGFVTGAVLEFGPWDVTLSTRHASAN